MPIQNSSLLAVTRWLIIACGVVVVLGIVGTLLGGVVSLFGWPMLVAEAAKDKPGLDIASLRSLLPALLFGAAIMLMLIGAVLERLYRLVESVRAGDPFIRANVDRLRGIGWLMVAGQIIALPIHHIGARIGDHMGHLNPMDGADLSLNSVLAILLVFVLAGVFQHGVALRDDVEGTI